KTPELSEVTFRSADGNTFVMPSITVDALAQGFQIYDGIILRSTAESNDVGLVRKTQAYLNPTPEQFARASEASIALGFNTQWLAFNKTPDVFEEPLEARISAAIISLLAIAVLIGFARSSTKFLRPKLAALRSVGIG